MCVEIFKTGEVNETGALNTLAEHTVSVLIGKTNLGIKLDTGKYLVINTNNNCVSQLKRFHDNEIDKGCRSIKGRPTINIDWENGDYFTYSIGTLVAFINDLIDRKGLVRETYVSMEGNHMDSTGSGRFSSVNNSANNMELVDCNTHARHTSTSSKLIKIGLWVRFSAYDTEFIKFVLSKGFIMKNDVNSLECVLTKMYSNKKFILKRETENKPYEIVDRYY